MIKDFVNIPKMAFGGGDYLPPLSIHSDVTKMTRGVSHRHKDVQRRFIKYKKEFDINSSRPGFEEENMETSMLAYTSYMQAIKRQQNEDLYAKPQQTVKASLQVRAKHITRSPPKLQKLPKITHRSQRTSNVFKVHTIPSGSIDSADLIKSDFHNKSNTVNRVVRRSLPELRNKKMPKSSKELYEINIASASDLGDLKKYKMKVTIPLPSDVHFASESDDLEKEMEVDDEMDSEMDTANETPLKDGSWAERDTMMYKDNIQKSKPTNTKTKERTGLSQVHKVDENSYEMQRRQKMKDSIKKLLLPRNRRTKRMKLGEPSLEDIPEGDGLAHCDTESEGSETDIELTTHRERVSGQTSLPPLPKTSCRRRKTPSPLTLTPTLDSIPEGSAVSKGTEPPKANTLLILHGQESDHHCDATDLNVSSSETLQIDNEQMIVSQNSEKHSKKKKRIHKKKKGRLKFLKDC